MAALCFACAAPSCTMEERVISVRGGLHGIPGAEGGMQAQGPREGRRDRSGAPHEGRMVNPMGYATPADFDDSLRYIRADGRVGIVSRNPRELIYHLRRALGEGNEEILHLTLSESLRERYRALGLNPDEAIEFLMANREEVMRTLAQFPMGDLTPGQFAQSIGRNAYRLEVPPGVSDPPLRFRRFDYVFDRDACRLLLIH
ncbi:MAG: hypothetical protein EA379_06475 [Phycisphaerales bacterium]|nr:MAG: hypothetical protein EA379_06475 [Phycisphaerales bacterium]